MKNANDDDYVSRYPVVHGIWESANRRMANFTSVERMHRGALRNARERRIELVAEPASESS